MLKYSLLFLLLAILAGVVGFGVVVGTAALISKLLFIGYLLAAFYCLVRGW